MKSLGKLFKKSKQGPRGDSSDEEGATPTNNNVKTTPSATGKGKAGKSSNVSKSTSSGVRPSRSTDGGRSAGFSGQQQAPSPQLRHPVEHVENVWEEEGSMPLQMGNSQGRRGKIDRPTLAQLLEIPGMTQALALQSLYSAQLVPYSDPMFTILRDYIRNSQDHKFGMKVLSILSLDRFDDSDFDYDANIKSKKRMLLSFGTSTNFLANILRNGFQPVPVGGIHFADRCSASANRCDTTFPSAIGYLLFCEVAVGMSFLSETIPSNFTRPPSTLRKGGQVIPSDSVLCGGKFVPEKASNFAMKNGCVVPVGKSVKNTKFTKFAVDQNEYIVYDEKLVKIRYLAKIEFQKEIYEF